MSSIEVDVFADALESFAEKGYADGVIAAKKDGAAAVSPYAGALPPGITQVMAEAYNEGFADGVEDVIDGSA